VYYWCQSAHVEPQKLFVISDKLQGGKSYKYFTNTALINMLWWELAIVRHVRLPVANYI